MATNKKKASGPRFFSLRWRAVFLYALVAAAGTYLMYLSGPDLEHFVSSAGHALVIAGVLALTVDGFARSHIVEEVSKDIYQFLMGHGLPVQLQLKIRDVMAISLVLHDYVIRYRRVAVRQAGRSQR